ncbi:endothelin-converting enzyme 1-like protein [Leptotrombidium deliense]|uniref:Endothelin-converting enzyme 1-like protein n=1 Tax=Leptotrombidium deliense TaxID=299467 RepID=A0A443SPB7_9ACAR|nr:endothelin-converting enzyme 1-like protein [Leptotrombidium deliense]
MFGHQMHPKLVEDILKERRPERLKLSSDNVCISEQCVRAAAAIIDRIDVSVDPCSNFYDFACGQFLKKKTVPDDHSNRNILQEMQDDIYVEMKNYLEEPIKENEPLSVKKVKMFYYSCMNDSAANDEQRAAQTLFDLMSKSGGPWYLFDAAINRKLRPDMEDLPDRIERRLYSAFMHQIQSIFYFHIAPDKNSTLFQLHVS